MEKTVLELLDELSFLSRETNGASFSIQHSKENGLWKVVFNNAMTTVKASDPVREFRDFEGALTHGIQWLKLRRRLVETPVEKYTLY